MDKARLSGEYHEVLYEIPINYQIKVTLDTSRKILFPRLRVLYPSVIPFGAASSSGGENLQGVHRENRANFGRHSHLPAEDVEHVK